MNKLLNKGKVLISYISAFAILAVSLLSLFTGNAAIVSSAVDSSDSSVSYPLNGSYDADVVIKEGGVSYKDIDTSVKNVVSKFTAVDKTFWLTTEGDGTAANPFIVKTANQFAAVATNNLVYDDAIATQLDISNYSFVTVEGEKVLDTTGISFKVAEDIKEFDMNNTVNYVDLSGDMTAENVYAALKDQTVKEGLEWKIKQNSTGSLHVSFKGRFDGNGVVIYGLMGVNDAGSSASALFPETTGVTLRNTTVKNCYFFGDFASALIGKNTTTDSVIVQSCAVYNNYMLTDRFNSHSQYGSEGGGVVLANSPSEVSVTILDSLFYGNYSKHTEQCQNQYVTAHGKAYDVTYPLFPRSQNTTGAYVANSIVLDTAPYPVVYNYNTFHKSTYENVYTNMIDISYTNTGYANNGDTTVKETVSFTDNGNGTFTEQYNTEVTGLPSNQAAIGDPNYQRVYYAGSFAKVTQSEITGSAAQTAMPDLDWEKWTVNANGVPTPKVYDVREYSAGTAWTGDVALFYSSGDGSSVSPYVISTAEELALMLTTAQAGEYFKLGTDIVINKTNTADWTDTAKQWFTSNDVAPFEGIFDGNGYTVSGIYYSGDQAGEAGGLIPVLGSKSTVKNVTIANSVLKGKSGQSLGAAVGTTDDYCAQVITISNVVVEDTVTFGGEASCGGVMGVGGYSAVKISDSISKTNGIVNSTIGQIEIKRSISVGAYPFADANYIKAQNVYTDTDGRAVDGVTVLANADMLGDAAATNMAGLNFPTSWKVVVGDYPAATGVQPSSNGVKGEVWTGAIASGFAGGDGSEENPWIIETAEQLALCVYNTGRANSSASTGVDRPHYKLAADIYLNDVEGNLWADKVGCNEWFNVSPVNSDKKVKNSAGTLGMTFDGDGYVIFGLYINNTKGTDYVRAGLFPELYEDSTVKNVGFSEGYMLGSDTYNDQLGFVAANVKIWFNKYPEIVALVKEQVGEEKYAEEPYMPTHNAVATKAIESNPIYSVHIPVIENVFVDHTCYVKADHSGGLVGQAAGGSLIKNCIVTATVEGANTGAFTGYDWSYCPQYEDSLALTQNCVRPLMGSSDSDWRTQNTLYQCVNSEGVYYFSISSANVLSFNKLSKPDSRVGEAAMSTMTDLDWVGNTDDGTDDIWVMIEGGTPLQSVFLSHERSQEQFESFSDKYFAAPTVMVTLSTGTSEIDLDPLTGAMYSKMSLPTLPDRQGYKFTGWYVFDDLSVEYPYDYFPPRSLTLFAGWETTGVIQNFESFPDTIWDRDGTMWSLNKPGAKDGYKNQYVHSGAKSMHLLGTNTESADCLLNYEDMLTVGQVYTMTFWVTTDTENNPATLISLVHNNYPDYLNTGVAIEDMAVVTGLKVGEWVQYSYSFTAQTKWVSLRASAGSSLYFDDILMAEIDGTLSGGTVVNLGGTSPNTGVSVSVAVVISAIMAGAIIMVVSRKNLVETIED